MILHTRTNQVRGGRPGACGRVPVGDNGAREDHFCGYKACRGTAGRCPHALVTNQPILRAIEGMAQQVIQAGMAGEHDGGGALRRPRHRVALAACPNACTEPQTKDVGIIAIVTPTKVDQRCNGCGQCVKVCAEGAIQVTDGKARILRKKCVGCGQCISECPERAIGSVGLRFKILVGGRMGRHPRWAQELCVADGLDVVNVLQSFFDSILRHGRPGERIANVVERVGVADLRKEVLVDVR